LLRRDLPHDELARFRERALQDLVELSVGLDNGTIKRQHPADLVGFPREIQQRLTQIVNSTEFLAPAIVRR
jgi:hypothetical protein